MRKLQRGFVNIVLSPMEISTELAKEEAQNPEAWGRPAGLLAWRAVRPLWQVG